MVREFLTGIFIGMVLMYAYQLLLLDVERLKLKRFKLEKQKKVKKKNPNDYEV